MKERKWEGRKEGLARFPSISNNATFTLFHSECGKVTVSGVVGSRAKY